MALHLKFALNLETLADEMMRNLSLNWIDPFSAPVVIFPDTKLERWFRLRFAEKRGALANLKAKKLDSFLVEILGGGDKKKNLPADLLRHVIIAYLKSLGNGGKENLSKNLDDRIAEYLFVEDKMDEVRLFDLAGKLATLFLDYEVCRPSGFLTGRKGILDCWKEGDLQPFFFDEKDKRFEMEKWERQLYSAIFHNADGGESLFTKAFKDWKSDVEYLTLPFLYKDCAKNGKPEFQFTSGEPVFILGLSGVGQFYRIVLQEFAKEHEVFAYIQNPCCEFWEDMDLGFQKFREQMYSLEEDAEEPLKADENDLLRAWGRAGRDNIMLWNEADGYNGGFDDNVAKELSEAEKKQLKADSLLHQVQWMIANRKNTPREKGLNENDESLTLTAAPNKIREVEAVHSRICKLLLSGAKISDFLVVAPNLSEYRSAIFQVFDDQSKDSDDQPKDSAEGVHLPFVILDSAAKESFVGNALSHLFAIKKNGSLCREDFFALVRNPVVQATRSIDPEEISDWESWVSALNVYRDHTKDSNKKEDWSVAVKRLLLARLSDFPVNISDENAYMPYSDIESGNDDKLNRFASAVESLESWIRMKNLSTEDPEFSEAKKFLHEWLFMKNAPKELGGEAIVFDQVSEALDYLKYQFAAGATEISWNMVSMTLQEAAETSAYNVGSPFIGGISFMKFAPNRTLPVKHLFFMGANAADFPGSKNLDSLDLRKSVKRWPGDESPVDKNRYAFLCQLMSTGESFHISYQNMYLPKDQELYPSSVVNDLRNAVEKAWGKNALPFTKMDIDETRPNAELFTARSRRNKKTLGVFGMENRFEETKQNSLKTSQHSGAVSEKNPERVTASWIRQFLTDPFEFQANRVLNLKPVKENPEKISLEPVTLDALNKSGLLRRLVAQKLGIESDEPVDEKSLRQTGTIPAGVFGKKVWQDLNAKAQNFAERILKKYPKESWEFRSETWEVSLSAGENINWTFAGTVPLVARKKSEFSQNEKPEEPQVVLLDVKDKDLGKNQQNTSGKRISDENLKKNRSTWAEKLLLNYVAGLGLLAAGKYSKVEIHLWDANLDDGLTLSLSQEEAQERLNALYKAMYVNPESQLLPFSEFYKSGGVKDVLQLKKDGLKNFAGKDLFDYFNASVSGFHKLKGDAFVKEWKQAKEKMLRLMPEIQEFVEKENGIEKGN